MIYNPYTKQIIGINALGIAPTGATADFFKNLDLQISATIWSLAAVTPWHTGWYHAYVGKNMVNAGLKVLTPAIQLAEGFPFDIDLANQAKTNHRYNEAMAIQ